MNSLKHLLCPIHNNKTCLSKPGLRMMKIVTENSTGQFITNCMRQHFNAKFDTAYYKLRHVLQSSTRLITNCDRYYKVRHGLLQIATGIKKSDKAYYKLRWYLYIIHFKVLSTFQTISISCYRPLTNLTSYARKLICIFTIFESLIIHSVCSQILHKFLLLKALQEIISPPNSLCRKEANSVLWGTQIIASYVSILSYNRKFYPKYLNEHEEEQQQQQHFAFFDV